MVCIPRGMRHHLHIQIPLDQLRTGVGFLVQRSIRGRAAEMGLKMSLLV